METEEERRARLENDAATIRLRLAKETDQERKARLEKMVELLHSSGWPWRQRKKKEQDWNICQTTSTPILNWIVRVYTVTLFLRADIKGDQTCQKK